jgi:sulfur-oxidizing protein SoxA
MRYLLMFVTLLGMGFAAADPEADREGLRDFYAKRFPSTPLGDHKDGVYAIDADAREQWLEMEDFPPYEIALDEGREAYQTPFASGASYSDCFGDGAVKHRYPHFDEASGQVVTLEIAVNECRTANGESALDYSSTELINVVAFMAYESRDQLVAVAAPQSAEARAAYQQGKRFYSSRRGQLNFACSSCHVQLAGNRLRAEKLSASLGHVTHWPVYRLKWQEVGGLHKRFQECNSQVGAEPFALQSAEYRNLEYFLSYLSNGLELNGPATRK